MVQLVAVEGDVVVLLGTGAGVVVVAGAGVVAGHAGVGEPVGTPGVVLLGG